MTNVLFWNLNKRANESTIAIVAASMRVDVIALAEAEHVNASELELQLFQHSGREFKHVPLTFRIPIFVAAPCTLTALMEGQYLVMTAMQQLLGPELLIGFVHLPSKMNGSPDIVAGDIRPDIERIERKAKHARTIVVGDFNMEPYDRGMSAPDALNAVMCRQIAKRGARTLYNKKRPFFYNPMWNLLGDRTPGPPGTYFYETPKDSVYWRMLDQVLLRPEAIDEVDIQSISIIRALPTLDLANANGRPLKSDHFPIFFSTRTIP